MDMYLLCMAWLRLINAWTPQSKGQGSNYIWSNVLQIKDGNVKPDNDLYCIQVLGFAVWSEYGARVYALKLCQQWSYQTEDMPCPKPVRP